MMGVVLDAPATVAILMRPEGREEAWTSRRFMIWKGDYVCVLYLYHVGCYKTGDKREESY